MNKKNGSFSVRSEINKFDDTCLNGNKKILFMNELDDKRKHILENLVKKNQKYQDLYDMIDTKNLILRNMENSYIIEKRVFSEKKKNPIKDDLKVFNEKRKAKNKEQKIKNLFTEIESFNKKGTKENFDSYSKKSINIKPINNVFTLYKNFEKNYQYHNDKSNNNSKYELKNLKRNNNNSQILFPKPNFFKTQKTLINYNNKTKNLNEDDVKKWIMNEKFNLNEPIYYNSNSQFLNFSKNKNQEKNKNKKNVKSIIYYSNDFFDLQLDNFESNLNKIGRNIFNKQTDKKSKKQRLLTP